MRVTLKHKLRYALSHPKDLILLDASHGITTRLSIKNMCEHTTFISQIKPKLFLDAESDESYIMAIQEELNQFEKTIYGN